LEEAATETGRICDAYKNEDIDLTILLTHIGFESDMALAAMLKPEWGVDMILGGHSHTVMDQPAVVNNILIAQAATGTDQIGRFDIVVDDETNSIVEWKWQLVPISYDHIQPDEELQKFIDVYSSEIDRKYNTIICRTAQLLTHPSRTIETQMGNLFADIFAENANCNVAFIGSGSIRQKQMGPVVTLRDLRQIFPYDEVYMRFTITGEQVQRIFSHIMRAENRNSEGECYQVNRGVRAVYDDHLNELVSLEINEKPIDPQAHYTIGLSDYHYSNVLQNLGISNEEIKALSAPKVTATSMINVAEEYLRSHQNLNSQVEGRLVYL
jgi:5'-nucleotidase